MFQKNIHLVRHYYSDRNCSDHYGSGFDILNTPGSNIYVRMGAIVAGFFSLFAFVEIWLSKSKLVYSKTLWMIGQVSFNTWLFLFTFSSGICQMTILPPGMIGFR